MRRRERHGRCREARTRSARNRVEDQRAHGTWHPTVPRTGVHDGGTRGPPVLLHHGGVRVLRRGGDGARHRLRHQVPPADAGRARASRFTDRWRWSWPGPGFRSSWRWSCSSGASSVYFALARVPDEAMDIYAVGKQWMWKFQHREGPREINELHVPVNTPVRVLIASEDVLHSLYFPSFRTKMDAVPGRYTQLWFTATKPGTYHIFCAEYCGARHSAMIGRVVVMPQQEFQAWIGGGATEGTLAQTGEKLFTDLACVTCHRAGAGRAGRIERRCSARRCSSPAVAPSPRMSPTSASRSSIRGQSRGRLCADHADVPGPGERRAAARADRIHSIAAASRSGGSAQPAAPGPPAARPDAGPTQ